MPIDAGIYGQQQPQPFNNPFDQLMKMRELQQHQQLVGQQIQSGQATEEARRQDTAKQARAEAIQAKFYQIVGTSKTPDEVEMRIKAEAPEMLAGYQKQRMELDDKAADIKKKAADVARVKAEIDKAGQEYSAPFMQLVEKSGYKPEVFDFALNTISSHFDGFPAQQMREQAQGDPAKIKAIIDGFKSTAQQTADASAQEKAVELPGKQADAAMKQQILANMRGGMTAQQAQAAAETARHNRVTEAKSDDNQPLVAVMGPDGKPTLVKRADALGKTPASNREQGRQVTSGDAGRVADINTSLDNLDTLEKEISKTGTSSYLGSKVPNFVTNATGLGAESKSRQGVIDRVKQMIGKALEGGVLRKEDEVKYEKILPTIGDAPDVAKSKLVGLRELLTQKKQNVIDALKDANYDVTDFEKRDASKKPSAEDLIRKYGG